MIFFFGRIFAPLKVDKCVNIFLDSFYINFGFKEFKINLILTNALSTFKNDYKLL